MILYGKYTNLDQYRYWIPYHYGVEVKMAHTMMDRQAFYCPGNEVSSNIDIGVVVVVVSQRMFE